MDPPESLSKKPLWASKAGGLLEEHPLTSVATLGGLAVSIPARAADVEPAENSRRQNGARETPQGPAVATMPLSRAAAGNTTLLGGPGVATRRAGHRNTSLRARAAL